MKHMFALFALPLLVWGKARDPRGIRVSQGSGSSPGRLRREVVNKPLVMPQKNGTVDCYFDNLNNDHVCYFSEHDYNTSRFIATCASETFNASTCECELSAKPDKGMGFNEQTGVSIFQPCDMCQLVETTDGGWAVEYNCSNILRGKYASNRNSSVYGEEEEEEEEEDKDYVKYDETIVSPLKNNVDSNISLGDSDSWGSHREESTSASRQNNLTGTLSGVILTMHEVTLPPSRAPIDENKDREKSPGGNNIRRRR